MSWCKVIDLFLNKQTFISFICLVKKLVIFARIVAAGCCMVFDNHFCMRKIILAFDSFKGSVSSSEITENLSRCIRRNWPDCEVLGFPMADGGEGTVEAIAQCLPVKRQLCQVHGPLMEPMTASYAVTADGTAIIEMAAASGLPLLEVGQRNPLDTTTLGTGELIRNALRRGYRKFVLGLGGSATNDAGVGVMHALGVRFLDAEGEVLQPVGRNLGQISQMDTSKVYAALKHTSFLLACDVQNPLYGPQGAAYVYAPQKGATLEQVVELDDGLRSYATVLEQTTGFKVSSVAGAGAAGGMAGGLLPFLNCEIKSGIDVLLDMVHFDEALQGADLVLTGEGSIDAQTCMGKTLSGILKRARARQIPIVGLGGRVEAVEDLNAFGFTALFPIHSSLISLEEAMQKEVTLRHLNQTALQVLRLFFVHK